MVEITLRIRFTQPCLGAKPTKRPKDNVTVMVMPRGPSGQVMFPPSWWRAIVTHGARVKGGSAALARKVSWSIDVAGLTQQWIRYVPKTQERKAGHVHHEAFLPGDVVTVDCALPLDLPPSVFQRWMEAGGKYLGISPYKPGEWGRFEVVAVVATDATQEQPDELIAER